MLLFEKGTMCLTVSNIVKPNILDLKYVLFFVKI